MKKQLFLTVIFFNISISPLYAQNYFAQGFKEYKDGNYKQAKDAFDAAIDNKENLVESYMYRGGTNIFFNNLKDAKSDLDVSFKMDSSNAKIFFFYGKYYFATKDYKASIDNYDKAISVNPQYSDAYCERGVSKCMQGDCNNGLKDMDQAIKIDPSNPKLYSKRGYTKIMLQKYDESILDFDTSLKIKPNQKDYANKGLAYFNSKMYALSIVNLTRSLDFNPNDPEVLFYRGQAYEFQGLYDKACEDYNRSNSLVKNEASTNRLKNIKCN